MPPRLARQGISCAARSHLFLGSAPLTLLDSSQCLRSTYWASATAAAELPPSPTASAAIAAACGALQPLLQLPEVGRLPQSRLVQAVWASAGSVTRDGPPDPPLPTAKQPAMGCRHQWDAVGPTLTAQQQWAGGMTWAVGAAVADAASTLPPAATLGRPGSSCTAARLLPFVMLPAALRCCRPAS